MADRQTDRQRLSCLAPRKRARCPPPAERHGWSLPPPVRRWAIGIAIKGAVDLDSFRRTCTPIPLAYPRPQSSSSTEQYQQHKGKASWVSSSPSSSVAAAVPHNSRGPSCPPPPDAGILTASSALPSSLPHVLQPNSFRLPTSRSMLTLTSGGSCPTSGLATTSSGEALQPPFPARSTSWVRTPPRNGLGQASSERIS